MSEERTIQSIRIRMDSLYQFHDEIRVGAEYGHFGIDEKRSCKVTKITAETTNYGDHGECWYTVHHESGVYCEISSQSVGAVTYEI